MQVTDDALCECGHALDAHAISAGTSRVRCPVCGTCQHRRTSPLLQRVLRLVAQGRVREARRVLDAAARRER